MKIRNTYHHNITFAVACLAPPIGLLFAIHTPAGNWIKLGDDLGGAFIYLETGWLICSLPLYLTPFVIGSKYTAIFCAAIAAIFGILCGYSYPRGWGFAVLLGYLGILGLITFVLSILLKLINRLPSRSKRTD